MGSSEVFTKTVPYQVPVQYVTESHIFSEAYTTTHFIAHLCGGCKFDKKVATVSLILQKQAWNATTNDILKANVTSSFGHPIANNVDNKTGMYVDTFNFTYHSSFGDVYIKVRTGAGSGQIYTLSLKFEDAKTANPNCEQRWHMTSFEKHAYTKYKMVSKLPQDQMYDLMPIFRMSTAYPVRSGDLKFLQLDYCFPHASDYKMTVTVVADDGASAFATYACPKSIANCMPANAPFHDTSGSAVNLVPVEVQGVKDVGPIQVVVRGDGRFGKMNSFTLAASKYSL